MGTPISIEELFKFVLYLLGIGVLGYLFMILRNLASVTKDLSDISKCNYDNLNESIESFNNIIKSSESITNTVDETLVSISPEIDGIIHSTNNVTSKVESIADLLDNTTYKVSDTVDKVTENIGETADKINENVSNITFYLSLMNEIVGIIGNLLFKR